MARPIQIEVEEVGIPLGYLGQDVVPAGQLLQYGADVSVFTLSGTKDATSTAIFGLQSRLEKLGFLARVSKVSPGRVWSNLRLTVSKPGRKPFTANAARVAITAAIAQQSLSLRNLTDAASEIVVFAAEAIPTAVSEKGRQQTAAVVKKTAEDIVATVGNPICAAIEGATGIGCKKVILGGVVLVGLVLAWPLLSPFFSVGAERAARRLRG